MLVSSYIEPVLPSDAEMVPILELASDLRAECAALQAQVGPEARTSLGTLLRAMNSYYTNKIEGQHTYPADLEDALSSKFSPVVDTKRRQELAIAHMKVEKELEDRAEGMQWGDMFSADWVQEVHASLYAKLDVESRVIVDQDGKQRGYMQPGDIRSGFVKVGDHDAPSPDDLPALLDHFHFRYRKEVSQTMKIVVAGAALHRLSWIHPFPDGNGRVSRLQNHVLLAHLGLTEGLWSPMRGLARQQSGYYGALHQADLAPRNATDGRGSLSSKGLAEFITFWLEICLDQVRFMRLMLSLDYIQDRYVSLALQFLYNYGAGPVLHQNSKIKPELLGKALHQLFKHGRLERGAFKSMLACSDRTASRVLGKLIEQGLISSPSRVGHLEPAFPFFSLRFLFPGLWPEAESIVIQPVQAKK